VFLVPIACDGAAVVRNIASSKADSLAAASGRPTEIL